MRVWTVSDLHAEYKQNMKWLEDISLNEYQQDTLIVAGDVANSLELVRSVLEVLVKRFARVFYTPGNHDLWVKTRGVTETDSLARYRELMDACQQLGVHTRPLRVGPVWIVPIVSWYHNDFDTEPDLVVPLGMSLKQSVPPIQKACSDYRMCVWPRSVHEEGQDPGGRALAELFDQMNEPSLTQLETVLEMERDDPHPPDVITFSHFLPRLELIPEKRMLFFAGLPQAVGSTFVEDRLRALGSKAHIFGHTHFLWDQVIDGVRYVQFALGSPKEQERRNPYGEVAELFLLYDSERGGFAPEKVYFWPEYYRNNERDPANPAMAPYTAKIYCPEAPVVDLPDAMKSLNIVRQKQKEDSPV